MILGEPSAFHKEIQLSRKVSILSGKLEHLFQCSETTPLTAFFFFFPSPKKSD